MTSKYEPGEHVFFIENARFIKEAVIVKCAGGYCVIRFADRSGGTRLRENRLYGSKEEAGKNKSN